MTSIGFIGTGAITEALVRGLCTSGQGPDRILLSPRNAERAAALTAQFAQVATAPDNQAVVNGAETVFLAMRPDAAEEIVGTLRFRKGQTIVSLLPTFALAQVGALVAPADDCCRVLPLPPAARRQGPIAIYPAGHSAAPLVALVGTLVELGEENEFAALLASTSLMASFFASGGSVAEWLTRKGVSAKGARVYVAELTAALAQAALDDELSYETLVDEHTTPGGLNAQALRELRDAGNCANIARTLDLIDRRIHGQAGFEDRLGEDPK